MSMLAERKRKQRWSLNPRGKDWSEDSNKFGQKMLEKMGWKAGKGLGPKEDGITEHVKVTYKNDSRGMGFKESDNQWTEHDTNFQSLLENLNSSTGGDVKVPEIEVGKKSLEEKSQKSRARVHYHKFTRGKDLSRYSEKDLANIFGKKTLEEKKETRKKSSHEIKQENGQTPNFGIQTVKGGTISEYFKKKLPNFGVFNNGLTVGTNGVLKKVEDDISEDERPSFGFGFKQETLENTKEEQSDDERPSFGFGFKQETEKIGKPLNKFDYSTTFVKSECVETNQDKKKKKKRKSTDSIEVSTKKAKLEIENPCFDEDSQRIEENSTEIVENEFEVKRKEKKSKGKKRKKEGSNTEIDNPNFTITSEEVVENAIEENQYEVKRKEKKSKKKQKTEETTLEIDNPNFTVEEECPEDNNTQENAFEVKRKSKSKKKKKENSIIDEITDGNVSKHNTPILKRMSPSSSHRRSTRKSVRFSEINQEHIIPPNGYEETLTLEELRNRNELFDINTQVIQDSLEEQQDENCVGFINTAFDLKSIDQISFYEKTYEKQISKKHRKMCEIVETTPGFINNAFDLKSVDKTSFYEKIFEKQLSKKKKSKKNNQGGLVNGIFSERTNRIEENLVTIAKEIENYQAEVENDINEVKKEKKKRKLE